MSNSISVTTSLLSSFRKRNETGDYRNGIIPNKRNKPTGIINNTKHELYVLVMSRTRFRVNPHSIVASLAKWLSVRLRTKWFWVRVQLQSLNMKCILIP